MMIRWLILLALLLALDGLHAGASDRYDFDEPAQRETFQNLLEELRCVVCQNQNLAESNASLAEDMRREVHTLVREGHGEEEVAEFLVARYGDFVLYRPPVTATTLALWLGPLVLLAVGAVTAWRLTRGGRGSPTAVSAADREKARRLLAEDES